METLFGAGDAQIGLLTIPGIVDLVLRSIVLLGVVFLLSPFLRWASASTRSLVWATTLAAIVLLPLFSFLMPAWHFPLFPIETLQAVEAPVTTVTETTVRTVNPDIHLNAGEAQAQSIVETDVVERDATVGSASASGNILVSAFLFMKNTAAEIPWFLWIFMIWAGGAVALLSKFITGAIGVWWLVRSTQPVTDPDWLRLAEEVRSFYGLDRRVRIVRSSRALMPLTWGVFRPVVLLSGDADTWSPSRRQCVLMHEYAHVKRWDCLTQMVAQIATAMHWFNPLIWWVNRRLRIDREQACDDYVLLTGRAKASDYAFHLLEIASTLPTTFVSPLAGVAMARPSSLEDRIRSILDPERRRNLLNRTTLSLVVLVAAFLLLPIAAVRTWVNSDRHRDEHTRAHASVQNDEHPREHAAHATTPDENGRVINKTFQVSPGGQLDVNVFEGNIQLESSEMDEAHVEVFLSGVEAEQAQRYLEEVDFNVEQHGNTVSIVSNPPQSSFSFDWDEDVEITIHVQIPRVFDVSLKNIDGNISMGDAEGQVKVNSVDGNVSAGNIAGPSVEIMTVDGNISMANLMSETIALQTTDGNVNTGSLSGRSVRVVSVDGHINAGDISGASEISTIDGNIQIGRVNAPSIALHTVDGHITSGDLVSDMARIETGDGNIMLAGVEAPLHAKSLSGHIDVDLRKPFEVELNSLDGNISLTLPTDTGAEVDLRGTRIELAPNLRFEGTLADEWAKGNINGGGAHVEVTTRDGLVTLK